MKMSDTGNTAALNRILVNSRGLVRYVILSDSLDPAELNSGIPGVGMGKRPEYGGILEKTVLIFDDALITEGWADDPRYSGKDKKSDGDGKEQNETAVKENLARKILHEYEKILTGLQKNPEDFWSSRDTVMSISGLTACGLLINYLKEPFISKGRMYQPAGTSASGRSEENSEVSDRQKNGGGSLKHTLFADRSQEADLLLLAVELVSKVDFIELPLIMKYFPVCGELVKEHVAGMKKFIRERIHGLFEELLNAPGDMHRAAMFISRVKAMITGHVISLDFMEFFVKRLELHSYGSAYGNFTVKGRSSGVAVRGEYLLGPVMESFDEKTEAVVRSIREIFSPGTAGGRTGGHSGLCYLSLEHCLEGIRRAEKTFGDFLREFSSGELSGQRLVYRFLRELDSREYHFITDGRFYVYRFLMERLRRQVREKFSSFSGYGEKASADEVTSATARYLGMMYEQPYAFREDDPHAGKTAGRIAGSSELPKPYTSGPVYERIFKNNGRKRYFLLEVVRHHRKNSPTVKEESVYVRIYMKNSTQNYQLERAFLFKDGDNYFEYQNFFSGDRVVFRFSHKIFYADFACMVRDFVLQMHGVAPDGIRNFTGEELKDFKAKV